MKKKLDTRYPLQNSGLAQFWIARPGHVQIVVDLLHEPGDILVYLPFTGSERICWDCKGERQLLVSMNIHGRKISWTDVCNAFEDA